MAVTTGAEPSVVALDTKVGVLEEEIDDINTRIGNLDTSLNARIGTLDTNLNAKIDRMSTAVTSELKSLSTALADKNKTPWGILISGAGVVLTTVALLGHQALSPIQEDIYSMRGNVVPRKEVELRDAYTDRRIGVLESVLSQVRQREFERLLEENRLLRGGGKS